jgi:hypothetical protein
MTSTHEADARIRVFFDTYEAVSRGDDLSGLRDLFAPSFIAGGPAGAAAVTVDMMIAAAGARRERTARLGHDGGRLTGLETTWLGPAYCLAATTWELTFTPPGRDPSSFEARSDFVLHLGAQGPVVVTYLARQDIDEELARLEGD